MKNWMLKGRTGLMVILTGAVLACAPKEQPRRELTTEERIASETILPQDPNMIRTPKGASSLDLETPLRCYVNWSTQEMIKAIPYNMKAFNLVRNGKNDMLPRFEVTGFTFATMPAEKAMYKLIKEAGIKLVAKDAPYASISAENLRGELSEVIGMIADAAEIYYAYDAERKTLTISRKSNFSLYVPKSRPIMLGLLDVLRGSGITDMTTDWADYSVTFEADFELQSKVNKLVSYFEENPSLITFDVNVFRIYPYSKDNDIEWQELLTTFDFGTIKTTKTGVIGRALTTSNDLNISTLRSFLGQQAMVLPVAEGKFVVPNLWFARFDIGKCAARDSIESGLSVLAKASLEHDNRIFSDITLEATNGQITHFNVRSRLGENFMIIGIPNQIFDKNSPRSETIVFMVPRIIRTMKTTQPIRNNL
ncbi:MAG: hypothetical protein OSJ76_08355 [Alphaproteobacteria bacterium]|nr:hypothetical protein [Alphaproteobacteria bacterium]